MDQNKLSIDTKQCKSCGLDEKAIGYLLKEKFPVKLHLKWFLSLFTLPEPQKTLTTFHMH